jgi:integration host factor subunit alpha
MHRNGEMVVSIFVGGRAKFGSTDGGRTPKKSEGVRTFTRHDLRVAIYHCCPTLSRAEARKIFDETFDELSDALIRGEPVKLRNFGTFNLRAKRQRTGRNPKTGVEAVICARRVVTFRPSPVLLTRINQEVADCLPD